MNDDEEFWEEVRKAEEQLRMRKQKTKASAEKLREYLTKEWNKRHPNGLNGKRREFKVEKGQVFCRDVPIKTK